MGNRPVTGHSWSSHLADACRIVWTHALRLGISAQRSARSQAEFVSADPRGRRTGRCMPPLSVTEGPPGKQLLRRGGGGREPECLGRLLASARECSHRRFKESPTSRCGSGLPTVRLTRLQVGQIGPTDRTADRFQVKSEVGEPVIRQGVQQKGAKDGPVGTGQSVAAPDLSHRKASGVTRGKQAGTPVPERARSTHRRLDLDKPLGSERLVEPGEQFGIGRWGVRRHQPVDTFAHRGGATDRSAADGTEFSGCSRTAVTSVPSA